MAAEPEAGGIVGHRAGFGDVVEQPAPVEGLDGGGVQAAQAERLRLPDGGGGGVALEDQHGGMGEG